MQEKIDKKLLTLAKKAFNKDEIPVSAVIVKNNKIISCAFNKRQKSHDVTGHAEILAIRKAAKKLKDWRLNGCDLYVTLKPCSMCCEIIKQSRINKVYFYSEKLSTKKEYNKTEFIKVQTNVSQELVDFMQKTFKNKR